MLLQGNHNDIANYVIVCVFGTCMYSWTYTFLPPLEIHALLADIYTLHHYMLQLLVLAIDKAHVHLHRCKNLYKYHSPLARADCMPVYVSQPSGWGKRYRIREDDYCATGYIAK